MNFPHYSLVPKDLDANLKWRREILLLASNDVVAQQQLLKMCAEDMLFYVNTFLWTFSPKDSAFDYPITQFVTYPFQDEAMTDMLSCIRNGRDVTLPKTRDMGASYQGLGVMEWLWHFFEMQSFLLVSRKQELVDKTGDPKSLFWKIDYFHKNQPRWLLPTNRHMGLKDPNRNQMHLLNAGNGSVIDGESTTENLGVGDRRTALFIDEFGAFPVADGFAVLRGTRDVSNCRIFNSTPRGQNAFYEVIENTSALCIRMHWSRHPLKNVGMYKADPETGHVEFLDKFSGKVEFWEKGKRDPVSVIFPETYPFIRDGKLRSPWYDAECARSPSPQDIAQELDIDFLGSDYQFFDPEIIEILKKKYCRPPNIIGDLEFDTETFIPKRFVENPKGKLSLWLDLDGEGKVSFNRKFIVAADVSAGTGASNSVVSVVDKKTGEKIGLWKDANTRPNPFAGVAIAIGKFFNKAFMIWDGSGPTGEVFKKVVVESGYGSIYYRRNEKKVSRQITDQPGYFLNPTARSALLEDYRDALGKHVFINRSSSGMKECLQFIRKADGSVEHSAAINAQDPSGARTAHGDEAIADALACMALTETQSTHEQKEPEIPYGCLAWRMQQRKNEESKSKIDSLGDGW